MKRAAVAVCSFIVSNRFRAGVCPQPGSDGRDSRLKGRLRVDAANSYEPSLSCRLPAKAPGTVHAFVAAQKTMEGDYANALPTI